MEGPTIGIRFGSVEFRDCTSLTQERIGKILENGYTMNLTLPSMLIGESCTLCQQTRNKLTCWQRLCRRKADPMTARTYVSGEVLASRSFACLPSRQHPRARIRPVASLGVALFLSVAVIASQHCLAQTRPDFNVVLVSITPRGIYLSHSQVKPGRVRFLIDNRTPLRKIVMQIRAAADSPQANPIARVPTSVRKAWLEATLAPGTYRLGIAAVPQADVQIRVIP